MQFVRRLYLPLLIVLCALWAFIPLEGGDDFWAHAAIGRIVLDTGHVPKSTMFLWSADIPWVFHAYGSGVIYAFLLRLGGPWLCLVLNFLLAVAPLLLAWRLAKKRAGEVPLFLVCAFVPALWFSSVRWHLRPEGFTVLFLTLTLLFLVSEKRSRWQYLGIAAMFALWPNLHGGVLIGILTLWVGAIGEALRNYFAQDAVPVSDAPLAEASLSNYGPKPRIEWSLFGMAALCSVLPLLTNPWGPGYRIVFGGTAATSNHISEWRQFWVYPAMNWQVAWGLCILCVVTVAVWFLDRKRRGGIGAVLFMMCALWISSRRHMWLTSTTCIIALAQSAALLNGERLYSGFLRLERFATALLKNKRLDSPAMEARNTSPDSIMRMIGQIGTLVILICACIVNIPEKGFRATGETLPVKMSEFLLSPATPPGRIFNDYEYSAALEWFLDGKRPLYIDLINAYPPKIFDDWFPMAHAEPQGLKMLDDLKVDVIALRPIGAKNENDPIFKLAKYLETSPAWREIYKGVDGRVWARRKLYNAEVKFNAGQGPHLQQLPQPETTPGSIG